MNGQIEFEVVFQPRPRYTFENPVSDEEIKLITAHFSEILKRAMIEVDLEEGA